MFTPFVRVANCVVVVMLLAAAMADAATPEPRITIKLEEKLSDVALALHVP